MKTITIGLAGDVMIGRLVNEFLDEAPPGWIWGNLLPILQKNDLNLINLEAALTKSDKIVPKVFNFKADPEKVRVLSEGPIHAVNLANNHLLDFSEEGLLETLQMLDGAKIAHAGAGRNAAEAAAPAILDCQGIKVGILGYTDNQPGWIATTDRPGIRYIRIGDNQAVAEDIKTLRPKVDLLIVSLHWGPNMRERPTQAFKAFAHHLIDLGADLIHGHSAHIFQGVEIYQGKLILYDTGDFVDDYAVDPRLRNDRTFLFLVTFADRLSLRLIPALIEQFQVNCSEGQETEETLDRMQKLSSEFHTQLIREGNELVLSC